MDQPCAGLLARHPESRSAAAKSSCGANTRAALHPLCAVLYGAGMCHEPMSGESSAEMHGCGEVWSAGGGQWGLECMRGVSEAARAARHFWDHVSCCIGLLEHVVGEQRRPGGNCSIVCAVYSVRSGVGMDGEVGLL
jgi:hypothetical protein